MLTQHKAIKYQVFPSEAQREQIERTFGCVRKVYNLGLEMQIGLYEADMKRMTKNATNDYCNRVWKEEYPYLAEVDKFALTNSLFALENGYKRFFDGTSRFPRFKSKKDTKKSYTTNFTNDNICVIPMPTKNNAKHGYIKLPKLGIVHACLHRLPDEGFVLKQATISKNAAGKYFVSVLFERDVEEPISVEPQVERALGLDYSSPHFYVDSNGESADPPHYFREMQKKLAREQRRLSKMVKGSNNYIAQKYHVARLQEEVANQRKDFCHKRSREIANSYDVVCVEDIDLQALAQTLNFGKATADNGFGMFRTFLRYKLEDQGKHYVVIDKWYPSTKTCHECGGYNPDVKLGMETWVCPHCGRTILRDYNAALNIRDEGMRALQELQQQEEPLPEKSKTNVA